VGGEHLEAKPLPNIFLKLPQYYYSRASDPTQKLAIISNAICNLRLPILGL